MRNNLARIGIAALLMAGSAAGSAAPAPADASTATMTTPACTPPQGPVDRPDYCSYAADIRDFIDMRDGCDHWRGEPWPEDSEVNDKGGREWALHRRKEITDAMNASCIGTDKRLSALKATYAHDPRILRLLDEYEPEIETGD